MVRTSSSLYPALLLHGRKDSALDQTTQSDVEKVKVHEDGADTLSVQISIEMPFPIKTIDSPTHKIKLKKTSTMATVELCEGAELGAGFQLMIGLAEIHVPRMWVEEDNNGHHVSKEMSCIAISPYPRSPVLCIHVSRWHDRIFFLCRLVC